MVEKIHAGILDTQEEVAVHMCGFDGFGKVTSFGGEPIRRTEVQVRMGNLRCEGSGRSILKICII